jgi:hypothetical protein
MRALPIATLAAAAAGTLGCGARTGLFSPESLEPDAGSLPDVAPGATPGCPYTSGVQAGAPWPMHGRCPDQDSRGDAVVASNPREAWALATGGPPSSPVVGADGTAYLASGTTLFAISPAGIVLWMRSFASTLAGSPALGQDGSLYVLSSVSQSGTDAALDALDLATGDTHWTQDLGPDTPHSPVLAPDGTIYLCGVAMIRALSPTDGSEKWRATYPVNTSDSLTSPAVGADGTVYVALDGVRNLVAITPSGATAWSFDVKQHDPRYELGADMFVDPVVGPDGTVYIASGLDEPTFTTVFAVRPDGSLRWTRDFPPGPNGDVAVGAGVARDGSVVFVNLEGTAASFTADGQLAWAVDTQDTATSLVLTGEGTALVGGYYKNVLTAIARDGSVAWAHTFLGSVDSPVIGAAGVVLVPTEDGYLHQLGP